MSAKEPLLDDDILRELREMLGAGLDPVLSSFGVQTRQVLAEMEQAITAGDVEAVRKLGHTLKGSAGAIGARALSTQAARIEKLAAANNLAEAAFQMELLPALVSKTLHALAPLRAQRGA